MKSKPVLNALFLASFALLSCNKEKIEGPVNNQAQTGSVSRIKTWSNTSGQKTYLYDNSGKLTEVQSNTGSKVTYEYSPGKITHKQFTMGGANDFTAVYDLNEAGLVVTEKRPSKPDFTATFIYNEQKQPVKTIYNTNGIINTRDFFYNNGNCDSIRISESGNWDYTLRFTHYTDKVNHLSNEAYGYPFFGKESKNLVKSVQFLYANGSSSDITSINYEYDSNGRPVKETRSEGVNIFINYISYY